MQGDNTPSGVAASPSARKLLDLRASADAAPKVQSSGLRQVIPGPNQASQQQQPAESTEGELTLEELSNPPTDDELKRLKPTALWELPKKYYRDINGRVFVNRSLRLDRIQWYGFDMDYTLAVYKSPEFESLTYDIAISYLLEMGYPTSIRKLKYDPSFPIRGLFLDRDHGNLLKVDNFGNIILCVHGRMRLKKSAIFETYPGGHIHPDEIGRRFYLLNALFALPEACLYADLLEHFEKGKFAHKADESPAVSSDQKVKPSGSGSGRSLSPRPTSDAPSGSSASGDLGVRTGGVAPAGASMGVAGSEDTEEENFIHSDDVELSYKNLFQDIRTCIDYIHGQGDLKKRVVENIAKYIEKDERMPVLLDRLRKNGSKTFLLTNSEFTYTNHVMTFLLDGAHPEYASWRDYFDVIIVGAQKPGFFGAGTTLRRVNLRNGTLTVSSVTQKNFQGGQVYNGGSLALFNKLAGITSPNSVLYVGDHIFSEDIIVSKKAQGWRNLLVIRELEEELQVAKQSQEKFNRLATLEWIRAEIFRDLDSGATEPPDLTQLRKHTHKAQRALDKSYNRYFGALFRSGSKQTFFSMQVQRYADLYASSYLNLLNYPLFYTFFAPPMPLSHEQA